MGFAEVEMAAAHGHGFFGPQSLDRLEVLLEARHPITPVRTEGVKLHFAVADSGAKDQTPP